MKPNLAELLIELLIEDRERVRTARDSELEDAQSELAYVRRELEARIAEARPADLLREERATVELLQRHLAEAQAESHRLRADNAALAGELRALKGRAVAVGP